LEVVDHHEHPNDAHEYDQFDVATHFGQLLFMYIYLTPNWVEDVSRSLRYLFIYFLVWLFWQLNNAVFHWRQNKSIEMCVNTKKRDSNEEHVW